MAGVVEAGIVNVPIVKASARVLAWAVIEDGLRNARSLAITAKERIEMAFRTVQLLDGQKHVWQDVTDTPTKTEEELRKEADASIERLRTLVERKDKLGAIKAAIDVVDKDVN